VNDRPSITSTVATTGVGLGELADATETHLIKLSAAGILGARREERWRSEVRSHLDRLLLDSSHHLVNGLIRGSLMTGDAASYGTSPAAVARGLALLLAEQMTEHLDGVVEDDR
jgi:putative protein kinase ArgK-like GTPase of G3E family